MITRCALLFILVFLSCGPIPAFAQQPAPSGAPRQVDLNEFVVNGSGLKKMQRKTRVENVSLMFDVAQIGNPRPWDSVFMLTRFPAPTDKKFILASIEGRLADFDTGAFEVFLTVLQLNDADTVFMQIPVAPALEKNRRKQKYRVQIRDSGIVLQPAPFYLGYGFHTKPVSEPLFYRLYSALGGDGARLSIKNGEWRLFTNSEFQAVFPFAISYLEL